METKKLWVFLIFGVRSVFCSYEYHFINTAMTWPDAQQYCRLHFDDLATFTSAEDIQRVKRASGYSYAWIGLFDDPASWKGVMSNDPNSWRWSATGTSLGGFQAWMTNEPSFYKANETCVIMRHGQWNDVSCMKTYHFVCFRGSLQPGSKEFTFVKSGLTRSNALAYCRTHHVDLAVIEDASDLTAVSTLIGTHSVWIGLSRETFRWSDNRISHFKNWPNWEPDNKQTIEHCVVEDSSPEHYWSDATCADKNHVICQQALKPSVQTKIRLQTTADLSDPAVRDEFLKVLESRLGVGFGASWIIPPAKEEKKKLNNVCPSNP